MHYIVVSRHANHTCYQNCEWSKWSILAIADPILVSMQSIQTHCMKEFLMPVCLSVWAQKGASMTFGMPKIDVLDVFSSWVVWYVLNQCHMSRVFCYNALNTQHDHIPPNKTRATKNKELDQKAFLCTQIAAIKTQHVQEGKQNLLTTKIQV